MAILMAIATGMSTHVMVLKSFLIFNQELLSVFCVIVPCMVLPPFDGNLAARAECDAFDDGVNWALPVFGRSDYVTPYIAYGFADLIQLYRRQASPRKFTL